MVSSTFHFFVLPLSEWNEAICFINEKTGRNARARARARCRLWRARARACATDCSFAAHQAEPFVPSSAQMHFVLILSWKTFVYGFPGRNKYYI